MKVSFILEITSQNHSCEFKFNPWISFAPHPLLYDLHPAIIKCPQSIPATFFYPTRLPFWMCRNPLTKINYNIKPEGSGEGVRRRSSAPKQKEEKFYVLTKFSRECVCVGKITQKAKHMRGRENFWGKWVYDFIWDEMPAKKQQKLKKLNWLTVALRFTLLC